MELRDAIQLVWDDVADSVYRHPTVLEAVQYARAEIGPIELQMVLEDQRDGRYDAGSDCDVQGDVYGAYVDVRNATQADVDATLATFDVDLH